MAIVIADRFKGRRTLLSATVSPVYKSALTLGDALRLEPRRYRELDTRNAIAMVDIPGIRWLTCEYRNECDTLILVVNQLVVADFPPYYLKNHLGSRKETDWEKCRVDEGGAVILDIEARSGTVITNTFPLPG
jgi:hypothetical protein